MIQLPPPRHRYQDVTITPFHESSVGLGFADRVAPASGTWLAASRAFWFPVSLLEPFVVQKAFWINGATVGTDSIDIGIYRMTDPTTGRCDVIQTTGAVLSAGTANVAQETGTWRVSRTNITSGNDSVDRTSYTTASVTLKAGQLYLMAVVNTATSAGAISAITGGPTFALVPTNGTTQFNGTAHRVSLMSAVPTVDYTGTLVIDFGVGNTQTACVWSLEEFGGVDTTTNNGVVQAAKGTGTSTTPLATLAAFASTANATFGVNANVSDTTTTPGTGFTEIVDIASATPVACLQTQWRVDNDTTSDGTITSAAWGAIAVEIKARTTFVIPAAAPGAADIYMAISVSGTTATLFRTVASQFSMMAAAGCRETASLFPLTSNAIAGNLTGTRIPLAGFSARTLLA